MWIRRLLPFSVFILSIGVAGAQTDAVAEADAVAAEAAVAEAEAKADLSAVAGLVRTGAYAEAETRLVELVGEHPDDDRVHLLHGEVLLALQRFADALPPLRRAAELSPEAPRVNFQLATALQATGDQDASLAAYAKEIELNEDPRVKVMAHINRSLLFERNKAWEPAADELEAVLLLEPDRTRIYGDLVGLHLKAERPDRAAEQLRRAEAAGFRSARLEFNVGARLFNDNEPELAVEAFRRALAVDPGLADAERSLGTALERLGKADEAARHLERYLELRPDAPDAAAIRKRLDG